jgi:uncharacterized membrane protein
METDARAGLPGQARGAGGGNGNGTGNGRLARFGGEPATGDTNRRTTAYPARGSDGLSTALGWFSIGLGLAQLLAPDKLCELCGVDGDEHAGLMRSMGLREMSNGVAILTQPHQPTWLWSRVAGDTLDLALLGSAMARGKDPRRAAGAALAVLGVTMLDLKAARQQQRVTGNHAEMISDVGHQIRKEPREQRVVKSITINRPRAEVYGFFRDFSNIPRYAKHVDAVEVLSDRRSRWTVKVPGGSAVPFEVELMEERQDARLAWQSTGDSPVDEAGVADFSDAPGGRGTEVRIEVVYDPPMGRIGTTIAKLFREEPSQQVGDDLRALKQVLETGDVMVSDGSKRRGPHPGQPG